MSVRRGVLLCEAQAPSVPERVREPGQSQDQSGPEHRPAPGRARRDSPGNLNKEITSIIC